MTARLLATGFESSSVLVTRARAHLTAGAALAAAGSLAAAMPSSRHLVNLCESLDGFIVATIAALASGRTMILPPNRLPGALTELLGRFPDAVCVADVRADVPTPIVGVSQHVDAAMSAREHPVSQWPAVDDAQPAAILFTSGSTGAPTAHLKTWGALADGARALMRSIAPPAARVAIVGTVAPQHMFGLETTVMLPLQSGIPVCAARPALPADLADALARARDVAADGVWLMTTPLQLRAFHRESPTLHGVAGIVTSTMPLDPALAADVERDWHANVHEIYGCTEAGILGVRRVSVSSAWTPADGVSFAIAGDGRASASGGHVRGALDLADRLRPAGASGAFELIGRDNDVVKVAGKRASLAGLTLELAGVPGVRDGAFFVERDDAPRVAAAAVAPGMSVATLRRELARRIDPAFLPRPLLLVDALPRAAGGKLPLAALRALAARARRTQSADAASRNLTAHTVFAADHPALAGHFPGRPIVPGVLLLAAVQDVLRDAGLRVVECVQAKLLAPVSPGHGVDIRVNVDDRGAASFEISTGATAVASGRFRCIDTQLPR